MTTLLNTLYVMTPNAYAHLDNDTLRVEVERETKLRVPLHHLGGVVCFGNVLVSPALMHRLAEEGKSLVMLDDNGRFKARLEGPVSGNILLRKAHFDRARDPAFALAVSRAILAGKIRNGRQVLLRAARETPRDDDRAALSTVCDQLAASLRALGSATTLDEARGIEGEAARNYFAALNHAVRDEYREQFRLNGRTRRPPLDRMNAMLSFLYSMLMNDCRSAVEAAGLDPQLGFLHAVRPGRAALALDLMEEFRAYLADRLALTLINRAQIGHGDFDERPGGAVLLQKDRRKAVVLSYQERKKEATTHPLLESQVSLVLLPLLQARLLARVVRGEMESYVPFLLR